MIINLLTVLRGSVSKESVTLCSSPLRINAMRAKFAGYEHKNK